MSMYSEFAVFPLILQFSQVARFNKSGLDWQGIVVFLFFCAKIYSERPARHAGHSVTKLKKKKKGARQRLAGIPVCQASPDIKEQTRRPQCILTKRVWREAAFLPLPSPPCRMFVEIKGWLGESAGCTASRSVRWDVPRDASMSLTLPTTTQGS